MVYEVTVPSTVDVTTLLPQTVVPTFVEVIGLFSTVAAVVVVSASIIFADVVVIQAFS